MPFSGVREALGALGADLGALARVRLELFAVELKEASLRHKAMLQLAVISAFFLGAGALGLGLLVVIVFWDTHREAAIALVSLAYLAAGGWAFWRLHALATQGGEPFAATIAEFERDLDALRGPE